MKSHFTTRYRCRCLVCRERRTLRYRPSWYVQQPLCGCGARDWVVDSYRQTGREALRQVCRCDGFPYPHRIGSGSGELYACIHEDPWKRMHRLMREDGMLVETRIDYD